MDASSASYDVFLCYNSQEKKAASWLESKLKAEGFRVFRDDNVLIAGASLSAEIPAVLRESRSCVVLLGPSGVSPWQQEEIDIAFHRAVEDPQYSLIVLMLAGANPRDLPASLHHRRRVDFSSGFFDPDALRRLIDGIRGNSSYGQGSVDAPLPPPYRSMAPRAEELVPRKELEAIVEVLARVPEEGGGGQLAIGLTTALRGAGGFGKTALAQMVCEHEAVRKRFPVGILWVTLGQRLSEAQRLSRVRDLLRWWNRKEPSSYETLDSAAAVLRDSLSGQKVLLVLDDVWLAADVAPFAGIASPAALLITTRNTRTLPPAAPSIIVDALELPRAVELLGQGLIPLPAISTLEQLAAKLGEWPILLKLVNAQLREEYREGLSPSEAFRIVEDALGEMGLTAFDREDEEARNLAVRRTVEASLQRLSSEDRKRYARLAVFAEDETIPLTVLQLLWKVEKQEVAHVCRRLADMSLLYRFDRASNWVQLHDVMRSYLLREHSEELRSFQGAFVDGYLDARETEKPWQEAEQYFVARLPYHLKESGRVGDLEDLLFSYAWLEKKISGTDVNTAMADYDLLAGNKDAASVREALLLSRSVLTADLSQLASHLHGRLASSPSTRIASLLESAIANCARPWIRPLSATLQKPNGPLTYSFQAHQGEVRAVAQLDNNRFATAGTEGEIHVWDFATGESIAAISAAASPIRHLATVAPNRLLAGSDDGVIRLWDLDEEQVVRTYEEHRSPITALRLRREEFLSGAEDGTLLRWNLNSELPLGSFQGHPSRVNGLGYLDARTMVSIGKDRTLRVWNLLSKRQLKALTLPVFAAENLEVTASNEVVLGTWAGEIQTWKPLSHETRPRRSFRYPAVGMDALCVLEKDFGASTDGGLSEIQLWNPRTGTLGAKIHVPGGGVSALARFGASHLLCGSKDGRLSVWAIEFLRAQMTENPPGSVYAVAALDATTAVSSSDRLVNVWNVPTGTLLRALEGHSGAVSSVCTLGSELVASSSEAAIRIWNPQTGELLNTIQCPHKVGSLAAFPALGGDYLAVAPADPLAKDQPIQIWHVTLGQKMVDLPVFPGGVATLCAAPGLLFVGTYDGWVFHFDFSGVENPRNFVLRGHEKGAVSLAVIDRDQIASGSIDKTIRVWDLRSQETIQVLKGHEGAVMGLVSISSRFLVSAGEDQTIKLWDLETGTPVVSLRLDAGLSSLAFMPDGKTLVAGDTAGTAHFLRLEGLTA